MQCFQALNVSFHHLTIDFKDSSENHAMLNTLQDSELNESKVIFLHVMYAYIISDQGV